MLLDTVPAGDLQTYLLGYSERDEKSDALMDVMNKINNNHVRGMIRLASKGKRKAVSGKCSVTLKNPITPIIGVSF